MSEAHQHGATGLDAGTRHWGREPVSGIFLGMASLVAQLLKNPPAMQETPVRFLGWKDNLEKDRLPIPVFLSFPGGSDSKESACNVGDLASIPGLGRFPWRRTWHLTPVFLTEVSPWTEEPGGPQFMGLQRIVYD